MGQRVAVLREGVLQQCDAPRVLYDRPRNTFVARFIGSPAMNLCTVPLTEDGCARLDSVSVPLAAEAGAAARAGGLREVVLGLRPEALELAEEGVAAEVEVVEELGADAYAFCVADLPAVGATRLVARAGARRPPARGDRVHLRAIEGEAHAFHPETGARLEAPAA